MKRVILGLTVASLLISFANCQGQKTASPDASSATSTPSEADVLALFPVSPLSQTNGSITVTMKPDDDAVNLVPKEHLEPYKPSFKEKLRITCGGAIVSLSTSNRYFKRTYTMEPAAKEADGGVTILLKNNGERTINASAIPIRQSIGDSTTGIMTIFRDPVLGAIPRKIKELEMGSVTSQSTGYTKVYVSMKVTDASGNTQLQLGKEAVISLFDVPVRLSNTGAILERANFSFRFRIGTKHVVSDVQPPPPDVICKTPEDH